ncbi:hypothetical protein [Herbaspirillum sp. 1130]|uniref:hypothetical protein n=1 Tax=Herbaspirillum sp. 1130 TaxID=2806562 RepID=UPI001AE9824F|nr:hypothetical protein [Herbaspirillum sp. 1130]MBP1314186.1 hypothetical protein [Herbaspirillum sp. 1130]
MNYRERIVEEFGNRGFHYFSELVWSSSLEQPDLERVRTFLKINGFEDIDVSLIRPLDDSTQRLKWNRYYDQTGQCLVTAAPVSLPVGSNNLKLVFAYATEEIRGNDQARTIVVANALRLIFGVPAARELLLYSVFDKKTSSTHSDVNYASFFDVQSLHRYDDPPIQEAKLSRIPAEAAFLLEKAFAQINPGERFILMWLAFETVVSAVIDTGNNGEKREAFFQNVLQSSIVNAEVFRLFRLRCEIFKEGRQINANIEDDCVSLYCALQLAVLGDCEQRRAFLRGYELRIQQENAKEKKSP